MIQYMGGLSVGGLAIGMELTLPIIQARITALMEMSAELTGRIAALQANVQVCLGLDMPDPVALVAGLTAAVDIGAGLALNLPTASLDIQAGLTAEIGSIVSLLATVQAELAVVLAMQAQITGALSGAGISAWSYTGRADGFGQALGGELNGGMPSGGAGSDQIQGVVLACSDPANWAKLSVVLKVA